MNVEESSAASSLAPDSESGVPASSVASGAADESIPASPRET
jgi:hypothetical protein